MADLEREYACDPDFVAAGLALDVAEQVARIISYRGMTRTELAKRMGVSKALVTRALNAPTNMTLRSIAQLAVALDVKPVVLLGDAWSSMDCPVDEVAAEPGR